MSDPFLWAIALALSGVILGSFLATLVIRWPQGRSMGGRSACDACGRTLRAWELVPLIGAGALRGRCGTCANPIDRTHVRIELACLAIGAVSGTVAPGWEGVGGAVFGWLLVTLAWLDAREFWLPDALTGTLAASGLVAGVAGIGASLFDRAVGGLAGFLALWLIASGYRLVRGRDGMGGGDPKLMGGIGLWLGWQMLPAVLLIASLAGLGVALFLRLTGRAVAADTALPLGTLLAIAAYPAWIAMIVLAP